MQSAGSRSPSPAAGALAGGYLLDSITLGIGHLLGRPGPAKRKAPSDWLWVLSHEQRSDWPVSLASDVETTQPARLSTLVPARFQRMTWSPLHTRMALAFGIAWILDGLEVTVASDVGAIAVRRNTPPMSAWALGDIAPVYLVGEVVGALCFGGLSDKLGRRFIFLLALGAYLIGSGLTAATSDHGTGWVI